MNIFKPSLMLLLTIATLLSTVAWAQIPPAEYFPLQTGNSWVFRWTSNNPNLEPLYRSISVGGKETIRDREYFNVRYFDRSVALRAEPDGSIVALNRTSGTEEPWLRLGLPAGSTFESHIDQCVQAGRIESRT